MKYFKIDPRNPDKKAIAAAVEVLRSGGVIVYPTDTLYGLGIDVTSSRAAHKLFLLKNRDVRKPVSLMVHSVAMIEQIIGTLPVDTYAHLKKIFPGPFTALLPVERKIELPVFEHYFAAHDHLPKIGFRIPDLPLCQQLTQQFDGPISTTSANVSGLGNVYNVTDIIAQFGNKLDLILDGGPIKPSQGSTIIDFTKMPLQVVRQGDVKLAEVRTLLGDPSIRLRKEHFTVLFICTGNINRSAMAEGILKKLLARTRFSGFIKVTSAGTLNMGPVPAHEYTIQVGRENNLDLTAHRSQHVSEELMENADLVLVMALDHLYYLEKHFPHLMHKVFLLKQWKKEKAKGFQSVADPMGYDLDFYRNTFKEIYDEIQRIMPFLLAEVKQFLEYNEVSY